ncbi:MAG: HEAT repeat domain-containing protein, partial [Methermicoccaceae archaeon]
MTPKVLVVDDYADLRDILKTMLRDSGLEVLEARDGKEAVRLFSKHKPDVVVMDVAMPEKDGITATKEILNIDAEATIIGVTAFSSIKGNELIKAGAKEVISKPVSWKKIIERIYEYLKKGDRKYVHSPTLTTTNIDFLYREGKAPKEIGKQAVISLISNLKHEDETVRFQARWVLEKIGTPAIEPLIDALKHEDETVRFQARWVLEKIGTSAVIPLVKALKEGDETVRLQVVEVLSKIGTSPLTFLSLHIKDEDKTVRLQVVEALSRLNDPRAVNPLIKALRDEDETVRFRVIDALGRIGAPAVEPLIKALRDEDETVRFRVIDALGRIGA